MSALRKRREARARTERRWPCNPRFPPRWTNFSFLENNALDRMLHFAFRFVTCAVFSSAHLSPVHPKTLSTPSLLRCVSSHLYSPLNPVTFFPLTLFYYTHSVPLAFLKRQNHQQCFTSRSMIMESANVTECDVTDSLDSAPVYVFLRVIQPRKSTMNLTLDQSPATLKICIVTKD